MFKRIRQAYWYHRDRGNGKKLILCVTLLVLCVSSCIGLGVRNVLLKNNQDNRDNRENTEVASGQAIGEEATSGSAVSPEPYANTTQVESQDATTNPNYDIDTSGMTTFLGYMSDQAYETLIKLTEDKCREFGVNTAKKLDFQKTGATEFDVIGYILVGNDKVCECAYNLKSDTVSITDTTYMESDIRDMEAARRKAEADELRKEQEETKRKVAKFKKKPAKKKALGAKKKLKKKKSNKKGKKKRH